MGLFFYPRGGSSQVAGYLSRALAAHGWRVTLFSGSLGPPGSRGNAATIYDGIPVVPAAYDDAVARWERGGDPMDAPFPMHPSYEDRAGVPDRAFPWVSPTQGGRMTAAWARLMAGSEAISRSRLLHLHHLTPMHDAAHRVLPDVPVLTHLHGTELKMIDALSVDMPDLDEGPYAEWWVSRARRSALRATATITISPYERDEAVRLLGLDPETVHCLPNGVDTERFTAQRPTDDERRERWLDWLVRDPQGWDEASGAAGSVRYAEDEVLDAFFDPATGERRPVLLFVGRFLGFKRVPSLVRAYARARERMAVPGAARHLGRRARGVGGGASAHGRHARGRRGRVLQRLARPRRAAARPQLRRLLRRAVRRRAVRSRLPRGDGRGRPGDRDAHRRPARAS